MWSCLAIDDYYVPTVIQVPNGIFTQYPALTTRPQVDKWQATGYESLIHSSIYAVLREATGELKRPEPGRHINNGMRNVAELIRIAAKDFMPNPGIAIEQQYIHTDMFERLMVISSLMYEGTKGLGRMLLVNPDNPSVSFLIRLAQPVSFGEHKWRRKILQMATSDACIIADSQKIYGLGHLVKLMMQVCKTHLQLISLITTIGKLVAETIYYFVVVTGSPNCHKSLSIRLPLWQITNAYFLNRLYWAL